MRLLTLLALILMPMFVFGDLYYWKDNNGVMHVTSDPPPKTSSSYETVEALPSDIKPPKKKNPDTSQKSKKKKWPIVQLYSTNWCGYCKQAKAWMTENKVAFKEYDVEASSEHKRKYNELGGTGYPFFVVGKETMQGWSPQRLMQLLEQ